MCVPSSFVFKFIQHVRFYSISYFLYMLNTSLLNEELNVGLIICVALLSVLFPHFLAFCILTKLPPYPLGHAEILTIYLTTFISENQL